jgi:hypothetical protein
VSLVRASNTSQRDAFGFDLGEFRKTAAAIRDLLANEAAWEQDLHEIMLKLGFVEPLIPLYWMNLLSLLNCGKIALWSKILRGGGKVS